MISADYKGSEKTKGDKKRGRAPLRPAVLGKFTKGERGEKHLKRGETKKEEHLWKD